MVQTEAETSDAASTRFMQQLEEMKTRGLPTEEGQWDRFNIKALRQSIQSHLSLPDFTFSDPIPPGYSQVSFNALIHESSLSHDGAEQRHAPNEDWKFRVWGGGYMEFPRPSLRLDGATGPKHVAVNEKITDTRLIGKLDDKEPRVMVTLTKTLFVPKLSPGGRPVYGDRGELRILRKKDNILLKEEKVLLFWREMPLSLKVAPARRLTFLSNPDYSQTMVPSPTLLFRFSSLTRNAHAIHLDSDYTRQVYELPKLIVHGPLTAVLMLDILGEALAIHSAGQPHAFAVRSFYYKNFLPLFVNEEITISCKKLHNMNPYGTQFRSKSGVPWEKWQVWIQRGVGSEATLTVRGSALVSPATRPCSDEIEEGPAEQPGTSDEEPTNPSRNV